MSPENPTSQPKDTKFSYEVVTFTRPRPDRDLTVKVNQEVARVKSWAGHMGEVRVVSLSHYAASVGSERCLLTIEYTSHEPTSIP